MHELSSILQQADQDCEHYLALSERERESIVQQNMDELEKILQEKRPLIEALANHDFRIKAYCSAQHIADDGLKSHIASLGDAGLSAAYQGFIERLGQCKAANDGNARLVRHSQNSTSSLLDLLRNQGESGQNVYDQLGNRSRTGISRDLTKV
ncbi:flagella synthesis protein FlgN [Pseudomonas neustonica]|nr:MULTISPECIES: flagellar protein FlgN [Pseudomonas]|tara:strand:- start:5672 stop:6130 length:459 start_codon:yes stop_codon:yes gene_type:complete